MVVVTATLVGFSVWSIHNLSNESVQEMGTMIWQMIGIGIACLVIRSRGLHLFRSYSDRERFEPYFDRRGQAIVG